MERLRTTTGHRTNWIPFIGLAVLYVVIVQGVGLLIGLESDGTDSEFPSAESVVRNGVIPVATAILLVVAVVWRLGWWSEIFTGAQPPVARWVRFVPIAMFIAALVAIDFANLADQGTGLILALLALCALVGFGEELTFRGAGVVALRREGLTETRVAVYTSIIFGLVHVSNAIGQGPQAFAQAGIVATTGFFFYLALRSSGTILVPMFVHGLWDFSLLSSVSGVDPEPHLGVGLVIATQIALIALVVARRHQITPPRATI